MTWTDPQMEALGQLWMEGRTASQIASLLGAGITRNAVIGKVHRLGLCSGDNIGLRAATIKSSAVTLERGVRRAPRTIPEAAPALVSSGDCGDGAVARAVKRTASISPSVAIADLTDETCRWPIDDPDSRELRYCGALAIGAKPYCADHSKLAYQPARPARRPHDRHALFPGLVAATQKA
jgi:GcrA cell cycle regulator